MFLLIPGASPSVWHLINLMGKWSIVHIDRMSFCLFLQCVRKYSMKNCHLFYLCVCCVCVWEREHLFWPALSISNLKGILALKSKYVLGKTARTKTKWACWPIFPFFLQFIVTWRFRDYICLWFYCCLN